MSLPAEWSAHRRCWMAWPNPSAEWPDYQAARASFRGVLEAIAEFEALAVVCRPDQEAEVQRLAPGGTEVHCTNLNDAWMRDIGPTFAVGPGAAGLYGVDWRFNGWGNKWEWRDDDAVADFVCRCSGVEAIRADLVLEGGALQWDGQGTVLTTRQCVLSALRNPEETEESATAKLRELIGLERLVWIDEGLVDDHTDGHVDQVAAFVAPGRVVVAAPNSRDHARDPNSNVLDRCAARLGSVVDARGNKLELIDLPMAPPRRFRGTWLPMSYVNFYIANGGVIVPSLGDRQADARALGTLKEQFPDRVFRAVDALPLVHAGGGIHCITQQQPEAPALGPRAFLRREAGTSDEHDSCNDSNGLHLGP